jgi:hypothetical protein
MNFLKASWHCSCNGKIIISVKRCLDLRLGYVTDYPDGTKGNIAQYGSLKICQFHVHFYDIFFYMVLKIKNYQKLLYF